MFIIMLGDGGRRITSWKPAWAIQFPKKQKPKVSQSQIQKPNLYTPLLKSSSWAISLTILRSSRISKFPLKRNGHITWSFRNCPTSVKHCIQYWHSDIPQGCCATLPVEKHFIHWDLAFFFCKELFTIHCTNKTFYYDHFPVPLKLSGYI